MTASEFEKTDPAVMCRNCGMRKGLHGGATNPVRPFACPASKDEPKYPKVKDQKRAGDLYDKRLAAFWKKRKTAFDPAWGY